MTGTREFSVGNPQTRIRNGRSFDGRPSAWFRNPIGDGVVAGPPGTSELDEIHAVPTVVVPTVARRPAEDAVSGSGLGDGAAGWRIAGVAGQCLADQAFEALFGVVGGHWGIR